MLPNVAGARDLSGTLKPAQEQTAERIRGIVALIMAIGRALVAQEEPQPEYNSTEPIRIQIGPRPEMAESRIT